MEGETKRKKKGMIDSEKRRIFPEGEICKARLCFVFVILAGVGGGGDTIV